jgi:uncharacterized protein
MQGDDGAGFASGEPRFFGDCVGTRLHTVNVRKRNDTATTAAREEIMAIYREVEARALPRQCVARTTCCQFRITGRTPMLTRGEALFAATGVRASGRKKLTAKEDGSCPLLGRDGRCTIYAHRPFGCRTHFCEAAGGMYPRKHVADLIQRLEALDERLQGDGPRPLERAVGDALDERG